MTQRTRATLSQGGRSLVLLLVSLLVLTACGGAASPTVAPTKPAAAAPTAPTAAATTAPAATTSAAAATAAPTAAATSAATAAAKPAGTAAASPAASPAAAAPKITGNLTVFAAASLTDAFTEMGKAIEEANAGTKVTYSFAGSPALRTQLREGAKADVFASADEPNMAGAQQEGTIGGDPRIFAMNELVVIVSQPASSNIATLKDLSKPGIKLVVAQEAVPVGNYARQLLTKASADPAYGSDYAQKVQANVVSQEANVRQIVTKVQLGEADAGVVYSSDVTPAVRPQVTVIDVPDAYNVIAKYPIAMVKGAANPEGANEYMNYVLSPAGQTILQKWGFIPVGPTGTSASASAGTAQAQLTGLIESGGPLTVAALQQLPVETMQVTYQSSRGPQTHTYKGARLNTVLNQAKLKENAKYQNDKLRKYVVVSANDGYESVIAWGEIDPEFANAPVLLAYEEDGKSLGGADGPLRLVVPTDKAGGRYVSGVVKVDVRDPDSAARS